MSKALNLKLLLVELVFQLLDYAVAFSMQILPVTCSVQISEIAFLRWRRGRELSYIRS